MSPSFLPLSLPHFPSSFHISDAAVKLKVSEGCPPGAGNVSLGGSLRLAAPCLVWGGNVQPARTDSLVKSPSGGRVNLNRLNDQDGMNRGVFSSTSPSIGNCSIFSNTQRKSIFLKVPVTLSSSSPGNKAAARPSSFRPPRW